MTEATDRAALIAEAAEYEGYCYFCGDLMPNLAAALAASERELAEQAAIIDAVKARVGAMRAMSAEHLLTPDAADMCDLMVRGLDPILSITPTTEATTN